MERIAYLNLPVRELTHSREFFERLGFSFNPQFSDDTSACMIVNDSMFVMLLSETRFATFTPNKICDATEQTEVLICLSCASRDEVDELVQTAVDSGGTIYNEPADHGFMYGHGFQDLDGHIWELMFMDSSAVGDI